MSGEGQVLSDAQYVLKRQPKIMVYKCKENARVNTKP